MTQQIDLDPKVLPGPRKRRRRTSAIIQVESRAAACLMIASVRSLMGLPLMAFEIGAWLSFDSRFKGRIPRALIACRTYADELLPSRLALAAHALRELTDFSAEAPTSAGSPDFVASLASNA